MKRRNEMGARMGALLLASSLLSTTASANGVDTELNDGESSEKTMTLTAMILQNMSDYTVVIPEGMGDALEHFDIVDGNIQPSEPGQADESEGQGEPLDETEVVMPEPDESDNQESSDALEEDVAQEPEAPQEESVFKEDTQSEPDADQGGAQEEAQTTTEPEDTDTSKKKQPTDDEGQRDTSQEHPSTSGTEKTEVAEVDAPKSEPKKQAPTQEPLAE